MNERCKYRNRASYRCILDRGHYCEHVWQEPLTAPTALDVNCPYCRSRPGESCKTRSLFHIVRSPHAARTALAASTEGERHA